MNKLLSTLVLLLVAQMISGQYQIGLVPRTSPDKVTSQKIGYTEVTIEYGSPAVKNRELWGQLVPFDEVWRAGANNATTVELSSAITINNMPLDSGKYALFIVPKEKDAWTVIFNKNPKQWGAFKYNEDEDALRVDILPRKNASQVENLSYSIRQVGYKFGSLVLNWGFMEIEIPFETNYLTEFEQEVTSRADQQPEYIKWIVYLQGAEHLLDIRSNDELAMSWIDKAESIMDATTEWNEQFYPRDFVKGHLYWTKAKLLARADSFEEAIGYAEKLKALENTRFYDRKKDAESIDVLIEEWKEG